MHGAFKDPKLTVKEICNKIIAFSFFQNTINRTLRYNPVIFDPYPISDLIKNLIPYFKPAL